MSEPTRDPLEQLESFGSGGIAVSPLDPAAVRRLGDQRRRRQHTMYGAIAAVVVAAAVIPTALIATRDEGKSGPPITHDPSPTPTATVITFPDGGVQITSLADTEKLVGTSDAFKEFIQGVWQQDKDSGCKTPNITVTKYSRDGFARGGVGGCGGYQALWVDQGSGWKEALGTQDEWICADLDRYDVPDGFAGECYVPNPAPAVITFPGNTGQLVAQESDAAKLQGTPSDFKEFVIGLLPEVHASTAECSDDPSRTGVRVKKFAQAGYAVGSVDGCSGHAALWKKVDGAWKEVLASQEAWSCSDLARLEIPESFAGEGCFGPAALFGPEGNGGAQLGMSADEVRAAGGTVTGPSSQ